MILGTHFQGRIGFWADIRRGSIFRGHLEALAEKVPFLLLFGGNLCSGGPGKWVKTHYFGVVWKVVFWVFAFEAFQMGVKHRFVYHLSGTTNCL